MSKQAGDMTSDHSHHHASPSPRRSAGAPPQSGRKYPPSGPLVIDIRDLGRQPGAGRDIVTTVPAPADLGLELIKIPQGSPLELDLRVESVAEGVLVTGNVRGTAIAECGRCLTETAELVDVSLTELFAYPGSKTDETTDDEVNRLVDDRVDLESVIRNEIVTELPLTPLCKPDCQGLCTGCGERLEDLPKDHSHELIDPRWAALREKFGDEAPGEA